MTPDALMLQIAANGPGPRRRVRTTQGEGMVTPIRPLTVRDQLGRPVDRLAPDRSRLSPSHEFVTANPMLFRACDPRDTQTRGRLVDLQERAAGHRAGRQRAANRSTASSSSLRVPHRRTNWRL